MIEPTESENKSEIDRFCDAMLSIKSEIDDVINGVSDIENNLLKNSPHSLSVVTNDIWEYKYSRKCAAFPLDSIVDNKFWPLVGRVDDAYGDRNLICSCAPIESFIEE